jgi:hypothetical protein
MKSALDRLGGHKLVPSPRTSVATACRDANAVTTLPARASATAPQHAERTGMAQPLHDNSYA